jgi:nitrate/nitrite-specific signal transduction histidine kinase
MNMLLVLMLFYMIMLTVASNSGAFVDMRTTTTAVAANPATSLRDASYRLECLLRHLPLLFWRLGIKRPNY